MVLLSVIFGVICFTSVMADISDTPWVRNYRGGVYDEAVSIKLTYDGGFIIAGYTRSFDVNGVNRQSKWESIAAICRREGVNPNVYYCWSKDFLEAGKQRLAGDTKREVTSSEVSELRSENEQLKQWVYRIPHCCTYRYEKRRTTGIKVE
ncbi:MAG: transposase [candidate division Zixibacteria bacterium]|nr:transposase [candidate division Zixibacteria bacterium]